MCDWDWNWMEPKRKQDAHELLKLSAYHAAQNKMFMQTLFNTLIESHRF